MDYFYFCPKCGEVTDPTITKLKFCLYCETELDPPMQSIHEKSYYSRVAEERFPPSEKGHCGNTGRFRKKEILLEEISQNPLFDKELCEKRLQKETERYLESKREGYTALNRNINTPKCPTCQSTNIRKISTASKVTGAAMFGLFSKTARSQFCCNNCGYKW